MNYIKHLTGFFEKVSADYDLNPTHISLYMAIFQLWNQNRFQNPISISRDELMRISKIASTATYHKCMKDLTEREYVIYKPSFNPFKGSILEVCNLDFYSKPVPKKELKKRATKSKNDQVIEQVNEQVTKQALNKHQKSSKHVPYINNINNTNIINLAKQEISKNEYLFSGRLEINYLNNTYHLNLPEGEYHTLSGYLVTAAGIIPAQGIELFLDGYQFIFELVSDTKIETVRVIRLT